MSDASSLRDLQNRFLAALYDGDRAAAAALVEGAGLDAEARVRVYRNSGTLTHTETLRTTYPAVLALVGEDFFESAAMRYRRAHPSHSGNLQDFGSEFAAFLESLPGAQQLEYLADVARLEWLRQEVVLAADITPLHATALQDVPVASRGALCLELDPSVRLFASRHAVLTLWRYAMGAHSERLQLPAEGERIVLWRSGAEVAMTAVDAASLVCIAALSQGASIDAATCQALASDPDFDVAACIGSLMEESLIVFIHPATEDTSS
ncbi:MAG: putative DNA-binding domain-containing protein [Proteobacteria bacterium]|nr:putative DNA-binding domain-containing protein [Pseudomonadota bacterium]